MKPPGRTEGSRPPLSTYRLGFHRGFRLSQALRLVPYFERLGITTLYASPLFSARSGSSHGYDAIDPTRLNPDIGSRSEFERLGRELVLRDMGLILDIVPNHMAAHFENPWWRDLLENGESSRSALFFDVDWDPPQRALEHRISLPILGGPYQKVLENRDIGLFFGRRGFAVRYWETLLPVDPGTLGPVLCEIDGFLERDGRKEAGGAREMLASILEDISRMSSRNPARFLRRLRSRSGERVHKSLRRLWRSSLPFREAVERTLIEFNGIRGIPSSFDRLDSLLDAQVYWLSHWKTVTRTLNYRRFFDVADLVGVRMEDERVFEAFHRTLLDWVGNKMVTGVRVDHVDGLRDPAMYLRRLVHRLQKARPHAPAMVWVEKILSGDESLPSDWPVMGTTGYEFMNRLMAATGDPDGVRVLREWYSREIAPGADFAEMVYHQKKYVAETLLGGELRRLTLMLEWLGQNGRTSREIPFRELQAGIVEVSASLAVYRTYMQGEGPVAADRERVQDALAEARRRHRGRRQGLYRFFERILSMEIPSDAPEERSARWKDFVQGWQQFTGPVMAKGVEDTVFYRYSPLISLNEVGGDPRTDHLEPETFHDFNRRRREEHPLTLSATSTHDTKRSEDVRARIHLLSEYREDWIETVGRWMRWNRTLRTVASSGPLPDPSLELFLYQTLVGAWPLLPEETGSFLDRMEGYAVKVAREAKIHSNWISPDPVYEKSLCGFVRSLFGGRRRSPFRRDFLSFVEQVSREGAAQSLAWLVLKVASPGVPDFYQGSELWDFSLVDPDNRRPVDYALRERTLSVLIEEAKADPVALFHRLLENWKDGRIKMYVTWMLLEARRRDPELFLEGNYRPLVAAWEKEEGMTGFMRSLPGRDLLVVVSARFRDILQKETLCVPGERYAGRRIPLPESPGKGEWVHLLTGERIRPFSQSSSALPLEDVMRQAPLAVLYRKEDSKRQERT